MSYSYFTNLFLNALHSLREFCTKFWQPMASFSSSGMAGRSPLWPPPDARALKGSENPGVTACVRKKWRCIEIVRLPPFWGSSNFDAHLFAYGSKVWC